MPRNPRAISRRKFNQAISSGMALSAASYERVLGANDRVGVGFIGYGLIGKRHVLDFQEQPDAACVAVSEAHSGRLDEARALMGSGARGYGDFRRLLHDREIQAVVVSTPDHWHALMCMLACAAGKDVYVEKPLTLFVREGQWMIEIARRTRRVVQVGTQQRSGNHYQRARQLLQEGHIGRIHSVRMHAFRNIMPGFGAPSDCDPPAALDWNMFLGPAPLRPYNPNRGIYHFRWFWDYSGGQTTNLGQHALDIMFWTLGGSLESATSVGGRFALHDNGETPDTQDAFFEFADSPVSDRSERPSATTVAPDQARVASAAGLDSMRYTAVWSLREASAGTGNTSSIEFYGTKGMLALSRLGFSVVPDKKVPPENRIPQFAGSHPVGGPQRKATQGTDELWTQPIQDQSGSDRAQFTGHVRNFLDCVKTRATPISDLDSTHRVSTMCHLANLSLRLGRKLRWDSKGQDIVGDAEASLMLERPYRAPWDAELRALGLV